MIEKGDFIRDKHIRSVCGIVISIGTIGFRCENVSGYTVQLGNGQITFIFKDNAELIAKDTAELNR